MQWHLICLKAMIINVNANLEKVHREMPEKQACFLFQVYISMEILINILCHESHSFCEVRKECGGEIRK